MPLKKCQDEKKIVEDALENSQKEVERLKKTHEDGIKLIENLCQDSNKNTKTIDELRSVKTELSTRNSDLTKTLSSKEQKIQDLEKALSECSEASGQEIVEIMNKLRFLFEEYKKALREFVVRPGPLPDSEDISDLMDWIDDEFKALPGVISGASDCAAAFSVESILKLLHDFDCVDLAKFREKLTHFPDASSTSIICVNVDVLAIKIKFAKSSGSQAGKRLRKRLLALN
jgi:archaellum component FlaC